MPKIKGPKKVVRCTDEFKLKAMRLKTNQRRRTAQLTLRRPIVSSKS